MIDVSGIIKGVCDALNECFDFTVYTEHVEQGLKLPCFFVYCNKLERLRYRGRRYLAKNEICIQYIPSDSARFNEDAADVTDRLYLCTEYITVGESGSAVLLDGKKARTENGDGFINFYISYDMFYQTEDDIALMEELTIVNEGSETA